MNNKKTKDILKKIHKAMKKPLKFKKPINIYSVLILTSFVLFVSGLVFSTAFYYIGYNESLSDSTLEKNKQEQKELMQLEVDQVKDIFIKYLMVQSMDWLGFIIITLCVGWIFHGVLR